MLIILTPSLEFISTSDSFSLFVSWCLKWMCLIRRCFYVSVPRRRPTRWNHKAWNNFRHKKYNQKVPQQIFITVLHDFPVCVEHKAHFRNCVKILKYSQSIQECLCQTNEFRLLGKLYAVKEVSKAIFHCFQKINLAAISRGEIKMRSIKLIKRFL